MILQAGDIKDIRVWDPSKGLPHTCYHNKTVSVYNITQNAVGPVGQDSCQENSCIYIEHIKPSNNQDSFLKRVRENDQKKKGAKEKGPWVQEPACSTQKSTLF